MAITTRKFLLQFFRAAALAADMTKFALGDELHPDLLDAEPGSDAVAMNVSPEASLEWLLELVRLDEELEHICVWGLFDPRGSTKLLLRRNEATLKQIQPQIALSLAFYKEILDSVAGACEEQGLWRRLQEEINEALKGPGYQFATLREVLYSALRSHFDDTDTMGDAEKDADREPEHEQSDDYEKEDEDNGDETDPAAEMERILTARASGSEHDRRVEPADEDEDDASEDDVTGDGHDDGDETEHFIIINDQMVSRGLNLLRILRAPLEEMPALEICARARASVEGAMPSKAPDGDLR